MLSLSLSLSLLWLSLALGSLNGREDGMGNAEGLCCQNPASVKDSVSDSISLSACGGGLPPCETLVKAPESRQLSNLSMCEEELLVERRTS